MRSWNERTTIGVLTGLIEIRCPGSVEEMELLEIIAEKPTYIRDEHR
jgi:hypothetical protein